MCLPLTRSSNAEFHQIAASQLAIDGVVVQRALTTAYACVVIKRIALMSRLREVHFGPTFCPSFDGGRSCMAASRSECPTTILLRQKRAQEDCEIPFDKFRPSRRSGQAAAATDFHALIRNAAPGTMTSQRTLPTDASIEETVPSFS